MRDSLIPRISRRSTTYPAASSFSPASSFILRSLKTRSIVDVCARASGLDLPGSFKKTDRPDRTLARPRDRARTETRSQLFVFLRFFFLFFASMLPCRRPSGSSPVYLYDASVRSPVRAVPMAKRGRADATRLRSAARDLADPRGCRSHFSDECHGASHRLRRGSFEIWRARSPDAGQDRGTHGSARPSR